MLDTLKTTKLQRTVRKSKEEEKVLSERVGGIIEDSFRKLSEKNWGTLVIKERVLMSTERLLAWKSNSSIE